MVDPLCAVCWCTPRTCFRRSATSHRLLLMMKHDESRIRRLGDHVSGDSTSFAAFRRSGPLAAPPLPPRRREYRVERSVPQRPRHRSRTRLSALSTVTLVSSSWNRARERNIRVYGVDGCPDPHISAPLWVSRRLLAISAPIHVIVTLSKRKRFLISTRKNFSQATNRPSPIQNNAANPPRLLQICDLSHVVSHRNLDHVTKSDIKDDHDDFVFFAVTVRGTRSQLEIAIAQSFSAS